MRQNKNEEKKRRVKWASKYGIEIIKIDNFLIIYIMIEL